MKPNLISCRCRAGHFLIRATIAAATTLFLTALPKQAKSSSPICVFPPATIARAISESDAAVVAKLIEPPQKAQDRAENLSLPTGKFEVIEVVKRGPASSESKTIDVPFFEDAPPGGLYLVVDSKQDGWWPYALTPRSRRYVSEIINLPATGNERLTYFQRYFEDREDLLKNDSCDEFELAPFTALQAMKPLLEHDKLIEWIRNPAVAPSSRRLYLKLLCVCGRASDLPLLESMLKSTDAKSKALLDAIVACYLSIEHADGLPAVEQLFLKNKQADCKDVFSVLLALRFLDQEENGLISRQRLGATTQLILDHPLLADAAIVDLSRLQDWSAVERVAKLGASSDPRTESFVRTAAIKYFDACPLPKAKQCLEQLRKIAPRDAQ